MEILRNFGFTPPFECRELRGRTWEIKNAGGEIFILKRNENCAEVEKSLTLNKFLRSEGVCVAEYLPEILRSKSEGVCAEKYLRFFTCDSDGAYTLMRKMGGTHRTAFVGDFAFTARNAGVKIARLHKALKKWDFGDANDSDLIDELNGWVREAITAGGIEISDEIFSTCTSCEYRALPRQFIHRDIQHGNILFEGNELVGFLDFDLTQKNARVFDIVYFFSSILADEWISENSDEFVAKWREYASAFLCGYNSENTLLASEIKAMHKIALSIQLIFIAWFSSVGQTEFLPKSIEMLNRVFENEELFSF
ncbi:MAG: phosphotransferase [Defluviitaleaceae bacterium]|nr:phosphotransferase [Defluviitaleaceae bacterium]